MKFVLLNFFISLLLLLGADMSDNLVQAFKDGNAEEIASCFNESVELSIPNNEGIFSKAQAKLVLKTFFSKNKPSDFEIVHNGESKNNSHYSIGNLGTSNGTYRAYVLYKEQNNKLIILELRIESDN